MKTVLSLRQMTMKVTAAVCLRNFFNPLRGEFN